MGAPRRATGPRRIPRTRTRRRNPVTDRQLAAPRPAAVDSPDARTTAQRNADALPEICGLPRAAEDCPTTTGEPPHLTITLDWDAPALEVTTLDYDTQINAKQTRRWACDTKIIPIVLGGTSEPLDVGRAMRTIPLPLRRAPVTRDHGCAFPGCNRPPDYAKHTTDH